MLCLFVNLNYILCDSQWKINQRRKPTLNSKSNECFPPKRHIFLFKVPHLDGFLGFLTFSLNSKFTSPFGKGEQLIIPTLEKLAMINEDQVEFMYSLRIFNVIVKWQFHNRLCLLKWAFHLFLKIKLVVSITNLSTQQTE